MFIEIRTCHNNRDDVNKISSKWACLCVTNNKKISVLIVFTFCMHLADLCLFHFNLWKRIAVSLVI